MSKAGSRIVLGFKGRMRHTVLIQLGSYCDRPRGGRAAPGMPKASGTAALPTTRTAVPAALFCAVAAPRQRDLVSRGPLVQPDRRALSSDPVRAVRAHIFDSSAGGPSSGPVFGSAAYANCAPFRPAQGNAPARQPEQACLRRSQRPYSAARRPAGASSNRRRSRSNSKPGSAIYVTMPGKRCWIALSNSVQGADFAPIISWNLS